MQIRNKRKTENAPIMDFAKVSGLDNAPLMKVEEIDTGNDTTRCVWFTTSGKYQQVNFYTKDLDFIKEKSNSMNILKDTDIVNLLDKNSNIEEFYEMIRQRNKIQCIKAIRSVTDWGLKESKDYLDERWEQWRRNLNCDN